MTLWEVDIYPAAGEPDLLAEAVVNGAAEMGLPARELSISGARGYLVQGALDGAQIQRLADELLCDRVVENAAIAPIGDASLSAAPRAGAKLVHVLPKAGVMDPVALSAQEAAQDSGIPVAAVRTLRKFWIAGASDATLQTICRKVLANDAIEQVVVGPLKLASLDQGSAYEFKLVKVPLRELDDAGLAHLSKHGQLYLSLAEMQTIQAHFRGLGRDPTDVELESVAQTWSEHCSHKTLKGRIAYRDENGERPFSNMLKETIFAATQEIRRRLGDQDWCVSVFEDNAGIVRFDDTHNICFKVETHNHPSALEPYGGANTGLGGVIRDLLGTGMGARPVCNTDVFCFAPPDTPADSLPQGVLHPRRVIRGVVSGVRDYGNRMGIPTVNGAVFFDPRYLANPLVYCGDVGILPREMSFKKALPGDYIVSLGGFTGRDGIHGATFSSAELTTESESVSGGAVQIGNAITEKMVLDVLIQARDRGLFRAVTDCGAGGFSSAVGEMGEKIGAEVWLEKAPLKYAGLTYTEIWISEAQERMVLAVAPEKWDEFHALAASEKVEATILGRFEPTGRLVLKYAGQQVADLSMEFLHDGRPPVIREAVFTPPPEIPLAVPASGGDYTQTLVQILASPNVCSKEWVIRQYDHEVQAGSVIKPLVGVANDGPSDAAVVRPLHHSRRGIVIACGMNPRYGDFDPYHMAAAAIDEAVRNCVCVGADPAQIAILDNFCWGSTDRPETLGSLVRAALACKDVALGLGTPFVSGKDSLHNEFSYLDASGTKQTIRIPPSLLISAMGQVADVQTCVSMDLKTPGNLLYLVGTTRDELGGSHYTLVQNLQGGRVPRLDVAAAKSIFAGVHQAIRAGLVRSCHDLSEGGLAVAAAEMAFAGDCGAEIDLEKVPVEGGLSVAARLFAESNSRFLIEVPVAKAAAFEQALRGVACQQIGRVVDERRLRITSAGQSNIDAPLSVLKEAWQRTLKW